MGKIFFSKKERAEMKAEYNRDFGIYYRKKMAAEGVCIRCHKRQAMKGATHCRLCAEYKSAWDKLHGKAYREKRKREKIACA